MWCKVIVLTGMSVFAQVQDEETKVSEGKEEDDTKEQEPWIGLVPMEMDDNKSSTGNQESFADAVVNKVSEVTEDEMLSGNIVR